MTTEQKPLVLVVDDEPQMMRFVRLALSSRGYQVIEATNANEGIQQVTAYTPDVVLLDLGLPDKDGIEVVKMLREWSRLPIIVISARGQEESKVAALEEGADDYITKPFGASELVARIRVALRHAALMRDTTTASIEIGREITVDLVKRVVTKRGEEVHLTKTEYKLLVALVKHAGMVMTHRQLLLEVWGPGHSDQVQYLRVYMTQLRHKLEADAAQPKHLLTELGVGYRLKLDG
ncbi:sensor histidine kinase [Labilithrix luteola]|uniref:Sensor histidine kinase n=1 Tax=Labilithrix luteola TaxID=1391654 RepID=A0A0K1PWA4_9BACT|nr:response regulator [Labilithrix luteola]AKU97798.1 sensor histidine kinase [Labilithrix luteola]